MNHIEDMLNWMTKKIGANSFFRNVIWIAGGTAAAQAISILSAPIVTRLYTPADFGVFTVFTAFIGIAGPLTTLRYAVTIPLADSEELAENVLKLCFIITVLLSLLLWLSTLLFGNFFITKLSIPQATPYLWLLPVCLLSAGLYDALSSWAQRKKYFKIIARTRLSQGIFSAGIKVGFGCFGIKPLGLLLGLLAGKVSGSGSLLLKLIKEKPSFFNRISWKGIAYSAKRFYIFPLYQTWSQLLLALALQLPTILLTSFFGVKVAGLFGLAHVIVNMPMSLIGSSVAQVYYVEIAQYGKSRPDKILRISVSIIKKMFFIGIIPTGIIMLAAPRMFSFIFGDAWYDAGIYARLLSPLILSRFISTPIMHCLNVMEKQLFQLLLNSTRVLSLILIFILCKNTQLSPTTTVFVYSIFLSLFYLLVILAVFVLLKKEGNALTHEQN
jgi:O-antigen/teichoic acid export membrane protein